MYYPTLDDEIIQIGHSHGVDDLQHDDISDDLSTSGTTPSTNGNGHSSVVNNYHHQLHQQQQQHHQHHHQHHPSSHQQQSETPPPHSKPRHQKKNAVFTIVNKDVINSVAKELNKIKCPQCRKRFDTNDELESHREQQHFNQLHYSCEHCHKVFGTQSSLWKHIRSHSGHRPYVCNTCDKAFTQLANLQRHQSVHNGLKPYRCPICEKSFSQHANMIKHQLLHTGQKPHKCDSCDKAFAQRANLKKHEMIHSGVKPHACPICSKSYSQFANMKKHVLVHAKSADKTSEKGNENKTRSSSNSNSSWECVICKATFDKYDHFKLHMKQSCRKLGGVGTVIDDSMIKKEPPMTLDENSVIMNGGSLGLLDNSLLLSTGNGHSQSSDGHLHHLHHHNHLGGHQTVVAHEYCS